MRGRTYARMLLALHAKKAPLQKGNTTVEGRSNGVAQRAGRWLDANAAAMARGAARPVGASPVFDPRTWRKYHVRCLTVRTRGEAMATMATGQRDARLDLRMSSDQKEAIVRAAAASGMSVSQWALDRLMMSARSDLLTRVRSGCRQRRLTSSWACWRSRAPRS
jgi:hypothetical protein